MLFTDIAPQVHFLNDAAHLLATASPETSAFLMSRRNEVLVENDIAIPDTQRQRVCNCCGHLMVPGQHGSIFRIETDKAIRSKAASNQNHDKRARSGGISKVTTCGYCGRNSRVKLDSPGRISRHKKVAPATKTFLPPAAMATAAEPAKSSANASSKKRAKNRKAGLQALLDQKQGSTPSSSGFGLTLSDFMKK